MKRRYLAICLLFSGVFCHASDPSVSFEDFRKVRGVSELLRSRLYEEAVEKLSSSVKSSFTAAFLAGLAEYRRGRHKEAIRYFTASAFADPGERPASYSSEKILARLSSGGKKSALWPEAVYHICASYFAMSHVKDPETILGRYRKELGEPAGEKADALLAAIAAKQSNDRGIAAYEALLKRYDNVTYRVRLASLLDKEKKFSEANVHWLKVLRYDVSWADATAYENLKSYHKVEDYGRLSVADRLYLADGARAAGRHSAAAAILQSVKAEDLSATEKRIYWRARIFHQLQERDWSEAIRYFRVHEKEMPADLGNALRSRIAVRLLAADQHGLLQGFIPENAEGSLGEMRLKSLKRQKNPAAFREGLRYLKQADNWSAVAEDAVFQYCLIFILKEDRGNSESCLRDLRSATAGSPEGGRSRYYLGRLLEKAGNSSDARRLYSEVYLESPGSSYVFMAFDRMGGGEGNGNLPGSINSRRNWIAENPGKKNFLAAIRGTIRDNAVDSFWVSWRSDLEDMEKTSSDMVKALFLIVAGEESWGNELLRRGDGNLSREKKYLLLQKAGIAAGDTHLAYLYLKLYMKLRKKQEDIFTMPGLALKTMYPLSYYPIVKREADKNGIEVAGIYALMRQESQYHPGVTSTSNAKGLLQLLPSTAKIINRKFRIPGLNLYHPDHNIIMGSKFYSDLAKQFHNDFEKIAAAYNGGPGNLYKWLKNISAKEPELFFEQIPYEETYFYVKITRANFNRYRLLEAAGLHD